ncbi:hypothetical protein Tco_1349938 [Tanacetum coccineum]
MINPAFVEANYEVLESLLRERRRQMRNKDLRTKLEYFSEEYDKEREMEPRLTRALEATLILQATFSRVQRQKEIVVEFEDAPNRERSRVKRNDEGEAPPLEDLLPITPMEDMIPAAPAGSNSHPMDQYQFMLTLALNLTWGQPTPAGGSVPVSHGLIHPSGVFPNIYPFKEQPMYPLPNASIYPNQAPSGLFADYTGCVTPFIRWIEDYPLPDRLKMPSHVGSYNEKGDPDNFFHLFEGAIRMQKWAMPVACHMFTYML